MFREAEAMFAKMREDLGFEPDAPMEDVMWYMFGKTMLEFFKAACLEALRMALRPRNMFAILRTVLLMTCMRQRGWWQVALIWLGLGRSNVALLWAFKLHGTQLLVQARLPGARYFQTWLQDAHPQLPAPMQRMRGQARDALQSMAPRWLQKHMTVASGSMHAAQVASNGAQVVFGVEARDDTDVPQPPVGSCGEGPRQRAAAAALARHTQPAAKNVGREGNNGSLIDANQLGAAAES